MWDMEAAGEILGETFSHTHCAMKAFKVETFYSLYCAQLCFNTTIFVLNTMFVMSGVFWLSAWWFG